MIRSAPPNEQTSRVHSLGAMSSRTVALNDELFVPALQTDLYSRGADE